MAERPLKKVKPFAATVEADSVLQVNAFAITANQVVSMEESQREVFLTDVKKVIRSAFPLMAQEFFDDTWQDFVRIPENGERQFILYKVANDLVASFGFDQSIVPESSVKAMYCLHRAVSPALQSYGIAGKLMVSRALEELEPDILLTTTTQTTSLWSWVNPVMKGKLPGYEVYPKVENGKVIVVPPEKREYVTSAFKHMYAGVICSESDIPGKVERAMVNLDQSMVRHGHHKGQPLATDVPWKDDDIIAKELNLGPFDGMLTVLLKKN